MSVILSLVLHDMNLYKLCTRLHFIVATVEPAIWKIGLENIETDLLTFLYFHMSMRCSTICCSGLCIASDIIPNFVFDRLGNI